MKLKTNQVSLLFLVPPQSHHIILAVSTPQEGFCHWVPLKTTNSPTPIHTFLFQNEDVCPPCSVKQVPALLNSNIDVTKKQATTLSQTHFCCVYCCRDPHICQATSKNVAPQSRLTKLKLFNIQMQSMPSLIAFVKIRIKFKTVPIIPP